MMQQDYFIDRVRRWDTYYHSICEVVSTKSPCLSRQIGAILVKDKVIVSTGFNGPARGYPHCKHECPRKVAGYKSGEGLHLCPATHAEANCIASAARSGVSVAGTTLYMNCIIPCKDCINILTNAGIREVVVDELDPYHEVSLSIAYNAGVKIRSFVL